MRKPTQPTPFIKTAKPDISYPCQWEYLVIGTDEQRLTEIIVTACAPMIPVIGRSKSSSGGRYCSLKAVLVVDSEQMRLEIFTRISEHPDVKMVI